MLTCMIGVCESAHDHMNITHVDTRSRIVRCVVSGLGLGNRSIVVAKTSRAPEEFPRSPAFRLRIVSPKTFCVLILRDYPCTGVLKYVNEETTRWLSANSSSFLPK